MHKSAVKLGLVLIIISLILDQASKFYMVNVVMNPPKVIPVTSFFSLVMAYNTGVSFSMFNDYGLTGTYVLIGVSIAISIMFLVWLFKAQNKILASGLGLIVGGAIGNLIDRIYYGAVVDFLHFYYKEFSWPAFNLADTFITIGVMLIFIETFITQKGDKSA